MAKKYRPISMVCEKCGASPGADCYNTGGAGIFHAVRIKAAIQKSVEAKEAEQ